MQEKPGAASRLAYQLFSVLSKKHDVTFSPGDRKVRAQHTITADVQAAYRTTEQQLYETSLKRMTLRQSTLDFQALEDRFRQKHKLQVTMCIHTRASILH